MIGFIHNIGNVVIKQCIHDLCHSFMLCKLIYIMFDIGIKILKSCDQHIRILQKL